MLRFATQEEFWVAGPEAQTNNETQYCMTFGQRNPGYQRKYDADARLGGVRWMDYVPGLGGMISKKRQLSRRSNVPCNRTRPILYGYERYLDDGADMIWALRFHDDSHWSKFDKSPPVKTVSLSPESV